MRATRLPAVAPLVALAMVAAVATSAVAGQWRAAAKQPEIVVLGSGTSLSVLVRVGDSRLLIAAGDDIDDFDRAYGSILRPTISRLDLLVIAGTGPQLFVPERLADRDMARGILSMRPIGSGQTSGALAEADVTVVRHPLTVTLHEGLTVTLDPYSNAELPDAWSIMITHQTSRILVVPTLDAIPTGTPPVSTVVVTGNFDSEALRPSHAAAIIARGRDAREIIRITSEFEPESTRSRVWLVHDSEFLRIQLRPGSIHIDHSNVRQLRATEAVG